MSSTKKCANSDLPEEDDRKIDYYTAGMPFNAENMVRTTTSEAGAPVHRAATLLDSVPTIINPSNQGVAVIDTKKSSVTPTPNQQPRRSNWIVPDDYIRPLPSYYPLEKSSRHINDSPSEVSSRISESCRIMSVQAEFDNRMGTANITTAENVEIAISLWQGNTETEQNYVIVEIQRRRGCAIVYHKYCRYFLDAALGEFDADLYARKESAEKRLPGLAQQMNSTSSGKSERENSLLALEIAASLVKKDRMDARQLGLESLCLLTDLKRTGMNTALLASRVILLGSAQDEDQDDEFLIPDELGLREAILDLVQFGRLGEGETHIDSDNESANLRIEENEHNDILHNLALAVLANALDVLGKHGLSKDEETSEITNTFLKESEEICNRDLLSTLLSVLSTAEIKPHNAHFSAQCLYSLLNASKEARQRARNLNAKEIVATALDTGRQIHVKLEVATSKVKVELEKVEGDDEE